MLLSMLPGSALCSFSCSCYHKPPVTSLVVASCDPIIRYDKIVLTSFCKFTKLNKQNNVNGLSLYTVYYAIEQCSTINPIMLNIILQIMLTGNVTVSLCYMKVYVVLVISNHM